MITRGINTPGRINTQRNPIPGTPRSSRPTTHTGGKIVVRDIITRLGSVVSGPRSRKSSLAVKGSVHPYTVPTRIEIAQSRPGRHFNGAWVSGTGYFKPHTPNLNNCGEGEYSPRKMEPVVTVSGDLTRVHAEQSSWADQSILVNFHPNSL